MEKHYSPEELEFIRRFELEQDIDEVEEITEEDRLARKEHRGSLLFSWTIGVLAVMPFLLSGGLLYILGRYDQIIGSGGLEFLKDSLSAEELQSLSQQTGLPEIELFVSIYADRGLIIGLIFTLFAVLIAVLILMRVFFIYLRNKR